MKYSDDNPPLRCILYDSTCFQGTTRFRPQGILLHSTGSNNPSLKRYVQPSDTAPDRDKLLAILGKNRFRNDWNHIARQAGVNAFIGKLADGTVATVQTLPWDYKPWGCGKGSKGSLNNTAIQFEICEDSLTSKAYYQETYQEAVELCAYLCRMFDIDPEGAYKHLGVTVPCITCHADAYKMGLGSNHGDVYSWWNRYGGNLADFRKAVKTCMEEPEMTEAQIRQIVREELNNLGGDIRRAAEEAAQDAYRDLIEDRRAEQASEWARPILGEAMAEGITDGSRPRDYTAREETVAMCMRVLHKVQSEGKST